jgi:hypothetical protein
MLGDGPRSLGNERAKPALWTPSSRAGDDSEVAAPPEDGQSDSELREHVARRDGRGGTGRIEDYPGPVGAQCEVVGLSERMAPFAQLELDRGHVRRDRLPCASCPNATTEKFHDAQLRQRPERRAGQRARIGADLCGEGADTHRTVGPQ